MELNVVAFYERTPMVGDDLYVPSAYFIHHGADDRVGGLARVTSIEINRYIKVEPFPTVSFGWGILKDQDRLREKFGNQRAYADPDLRPEFNDGGY